MIQRQPVVGQARFCRSRAPRRCGQNGHTLPCELIDGSDVLRGRHEVPTPERAVQIGRQQSDHCFMSNYLSDGRDTGVPPFAREDANLPWKLQAGFRGTMAEAAVTTHVARALHLSPHQIVLGGNHRDGSKTLRKRWTPDHHHDAAVER